MGQWTVVLLAVSAAFAFAVSTSFKHASAAAAPDAQSLHGRSIGRFVRATVAQPLWLAGIGCDLAGLLLQIVALHLGALAVVQLLLISSLLFALLIHRVLDHHTLTRYQLSWAAVLTLALAGFLPLASISAATTPDTGADRTPALISGALGAVLAAACVLLGRRARARGQSAALLGVAVGILNAAAAALLKSVTNIATGPQHGLTSLLLAWQLYALIAVGVTGLLFTQLAFQAGPLAASLPASATIDPLLSVVIGVAVYDEHIRRGPGAGIALILILLIIGTAVIQLARIPDPLTRAGPAHPTPT